MIQETLNEIERITGLKLILCEDFAGIRNHNGRNYFNISLKTQYWISQEINVLERYSEKYKKITIEPNGEKRIAIFIL
jgi:hypothetical protein